MESERRVFHAVLSVAPLKLSVSRPDQMPVIVFHAVLSVAPLKRRLDRKGWSIHLVFHAVLSVAPLKLGLRVRIGSSLRCLPRCDQRGPIEASTRFRPICWPCSVSSTL